MRKRSYSLRDELDAVFERAKRIDPGELELLADFSRYLCVLVSGYLEQSYRNAIAQYASLRANKPVANFVIQSTSRLTNLTSERLTSHLTSFDTAWKSKLDLIFVDETKDAINSVIALRHSIAHGLPADVTFERVTRYYLQVKKVVDEIELLLGIA